MTLALGVLPVVLLLMGFPVFLVLLTGASVAVVFLMNVPLPVLHQTIFGSINAYAVLAVPFFIYAGELMSRGTVTIRLVDLVRASVGPARGSIGLTTVGTATIFGAISGVSAAAVATVGRILYPSLRTAGYRPPFAAGLVTSVGALGVIIPPSVPILIYAAAAEQSVPRLYAAALVPGLLTAVALAVLVLFVARRQGIDAGQAFDLRGLVRAAVRGIFALGAPVIILGGIYGGIFSPTEAAAVACVYAALVSLLVFRDLGLGGIIEAAAATVLLSGQILIIVAAAGVFSWLLTVNQVPATLVALIEASQLPAWALLLIINILLLLIGCVLDPLSAILLLTPLLVPLVVSVGVDPIHFGIVMALNLAIGLFTPPFGINIFIAQSVVGVDVKDIYRGVLPFVLCYGAVLLLITYVPQLSLVGLNLLVP